MKRFFILFVILCASTCALAQKADIAFTLGGSFVSDSQQTFSTGPSSITKLKTDNHIFLEGTLGALSHASHNEYREKLFEVHRTQGVKAYLDMRDGPFQPEPMGPRSAKARAARAKRGAP